MSRLLHEIEDNPRLPAFLRRYMMDYLEFIFRTFKLYEPVISVIEAVLNKTNTDIIIDLCSGSGGPISSIVTELSSRKQISAVLTDKYPNPGNALEQSIKYDLRSINAKDVPVDLKGLRTMFSALHHFESDELLSILSDAVRKNQPIAFFDSSDKNPFLMLLIILFHPIAFILFTPFIRPFSYLRLLFTYVIPLVPLFTIWDGIVSVIHLHSPGSLNKLIRNKQLQHNYTWQVQILRNKIGLKITSLTGIRKIM